MNTETANAEQIEYWNGDAGANWSERDAEMDAMLRPLGLTAIDIAAPAAGEQVLDIGCGCGATSMILAERVGADGGVLGVDISAPMLAVASEKRAALPAEQCAAIDFSQADAAHFQFPAEKFDLLFSRFGVMFFEDPVVAFSNIHTALKPTGRLTFLCWGPVQENEWITLPMSAAMSLLSPPEPADPRAPGPFAFADRGYVSDILSSAGFADINFEATTPTMRMGRGRTVEETADFFMDMGPVSRALGAGDDIQRNAVRDAIVAAISGRYVGDALELQSRCWVVTANA